METRPAQREGLLQKSVAPLALLIFVVLAWLIHSLNYRPYVTIDDANITKVYAQHLAQGDGWVYNTGSERVEGTTSFLQTLFWVAAFRTPYPDTFMHLFHLGIALVTFWSAIRILALYRDSNSLDGLALLYLCWLAIHPGILNWMTITVMDVSPWSMFLLLAVYSNCKLAKTGDARRYVIAISILSFCLVITRPESLAIVPLLIISGTLTHWLRGPRTIQFRPLIQSCKACFLVPFAVYAFSAAALTLFRLKYFGYPVPNTFYAKVSPHVLTNVKNGIFYVFNTFRAYPLAMPLFLVLAGVVCYSLWCIRTRNGESSTLFMNLLIAVPALALTVVAVMNGGDHFSQARFLIPVYLLLPLPLIRLVSLSWLPRHSAMRLLLSGVCVLAFLGMDMNTLSAVETLSPLRLEFSIAEDGIATGAILNAAFPSDAPSVGVAAAGGIARSYKGWVIDLMGLNNTKMAHSDHGMPGVKNHSGFNRTVFFSQLPDLVYPLILDNGPCGAACLSPWSFENMISRGLLEDPEFLAVYTAVELRSRDGVQVGDSPLLHAQPRFLAPILESARARRLGVRVYIKKTLLSRIATDIFDIVPIHTIPRATQPEAVNPPSLGILGRIKPF